MSQSPTSTDAYAELSPSAKLVHMVLQEQAPLTQGDLVDETRLSARTVRDAVSRLEAEDLITEEVCLRDARKRVYSIDGATQQAGTTGA